MSIPAVVHTASLPWAFYSELAALAKRHGWDPFALLAVMYSESDVNPAAGGHPAVGLIQFEPFRLPGVGWNDGPDAFLELSAVAQLPYVERYYVQDRLPPGADVSTVYLVNYEPAKLDEAHGNPHFVLDREGEPYYARNGPVFDTAGKGYIELADLGARIDRIATGATWDEHVARLAYAGGTRAIGLWAPILAVAAGISLTVGAAWAWGYRP